MQVRAPRTFAVVAVVALASMGGIAWAAIPGDDGLIRGCYTKVGGILRVIDTAKGQHCHGTLEVPITWSQQGPQGDPGAQGPAGRTGAAGRDGTDGASPAVNQLASGDENCPAGGAAITDARGSTAYVCGSQAGGDGQPFNGTWSSPNGEYTISVADDGIVLAHGPEAAIRLTGQTITILSGQAFQLTAGTNFVVDAGRTMALSSGTDSIIATGRSFTVDAATSVSARAGSTATLESGGATTMQAGSGFSIAGTQVRLNGGSSCAPAARIGDSVTGAAISGGSTTVCAG